MGAREARVSRQTWVCKQKRLGGNSSSGQYDDKHCAFGKRKVRRHVRPRGCACHAKDPPANAKHQACWNISLLKLKCRAAPLFTNSDLWRRTCSARGARCRTRFQPARTNAHCAHAALKRGGAWRRVALRCTNFRQHQPMSARPYDRPPHTRTLHVHIHANACVRATRPLASQRGVARLHHMYVCLWISHVTHALCLKLARAVHAAGYAAGMVCSYNNQATITSRSYLLNACLAKIWRAPLRMLRPARPRPTARAIRRAGRAPQILTHATHSCSAQAVAPRLPAQHAPHA